MPEYISPASSAAALPGDGLVSAAHIQDTPLRTAGKTVLIDNYDSFTYNVVEVSSRRRVVFVVVDVVMVISMPPGKHAADLSFRCRALHRPVLIRAGRRFGGISQR